MNLKPSKKLWQSASSKPLDPVIEHYTIGTDQKLDEYLVGYDCVASLAHAYMLSRQGYLTKAEFSKAKQALKEIYDQAIQRKFPIGDAEDGHSAIENYLTKHVGELGGKIHLGRSRNDQSATAIRVFAKDELIKIRSELLGTITVLLKLAQKYKSLPMPGYTHTRAAMVTTLGHYFAAFAETLLLDYRGLVSVSETFDSCPLGGAAGYGTTVPVDRKLTAKLLGFSSVQNNTLSAQLSRGQFELAVLEAALNINLTLSRLSNDLIYFASPEYDFFSLTDNIATGSSIMPQKRNPDPLEILRAAAGSLLGQVVEVASIIKGIPAGYQRDLQLTKKPFVEGVKFIKHSLQTIQVVLNNLIVNKDKLELAAENPHLYAADIANELVLQKGLSFREAYRKVKEEYTHATYRNTVAFADLPDFVPAHTNQRKKSLGMPGNLNLGPAQKELATANRKLSAEQKKFTAIIRKIWSL